MKMLTQKIILIVIATFALILLGHNISEAKTTYDAKVELDGNHVKVTFTIGEDSFSDELKGLYKESGWTVTGDKTIEKDMKPDSYWGYVCYPSNNDIQVAVIAMPMTMSMDDVHGFSDGPISVDTGNHAVAIIGESNTTGEPTLIPVNPGETTLTIIYDEGGVVGKVTYTSKLIVTAGETTDENPGETPDETSGETPDENPGETPDENSGETPDGNPGETPDKNPGETPDKTPGGSDNNQGGEANKGNTKKDGSVSDNILAKAGESPIIMLIIIVAGAFAIRSKVKYDKSKIK